MPQVLPSTHNSPETAYVIDDYPFGRTLRCFKRIWVETATKGTKEGQQRVVYQTTNRAVNRDKDSYDSAPMDKPYAWNKPKAGIYGSIQILWIDEETGHVEIAGLGQYPWDNHIKTFMDQFGNDLDEEQRKRVEFVTS